MSNKNWEDYINWKAILQYFLLAGIIYLAANDKEGWGWLTFALILTL